MNLFEPLDARTMRDIAAIARVHAGEQCCNKACGEDATSVIEGDVFCDVHAAMVREAIAYAQSLADGTV